MECRKDKRMKMKIIPICLFVLAGLGLLGGIVLNCQNIQDLPSDFEDAMELKINADLNLIYGTITVLDAETDEPVTGKAMVAIEKKEEDSAMIVSIDGDRVDTAKFTGGIFQFVLNEGYTPPIDLPVVVWANGYDTFYTVITISHDQQQQLSKIRCSASSEMTIKSPPTFCSAP